MFDTHVTKHCHHPKKDLLSVVHATKPGEVSQCVNCDSTVFFNGAKWKHANDKTSCGFECVPDYDQPVDFTETTEIKFLGITFRKASKRPYTWKCQHGCEEPTMESWMSEISGYYDPANTCERSATPTPVVEPA